MSTNTAVSTAPSNSRSLRAWLTPPVVALSAALLVFGGLGLARVGPWADWPVSLRWALATMFLLTASARLGPRRVNLLDMVPSVLPRAELLVALTGGLEALGALGLLLPASASAAGWCLAILLVAMFPANIVAARAAVGSGRRTGTPFGIRSAQQLVFIACAVLSAA